MDRRVLGILTALAAAVFIFSSYKVGTYWYQTWLSQKSTQALSGVVLKRPVIEDDLELAPIEIDFKSLTEQYPDVVGWLYCEDTPVNYPVVRGNDNQYYLNRLYNKKYNVNGSLFMDFRCSKDFSDYNTVIYGHNIKSGIMFHTLVQYKDSDFYQQHPCWYLMTPEADYRLDIVSGYITPSDSSAYSFPKTEKENLDFIKYSTKKSSFDSPYSIAPAQGSPDAQEALQGSQAAADAGYSMPVNGERILPVRNSYLYECFSGIVHSEQFHQRIEHYTENHIDPYVLEPRLLNPSDHFITLSTCSYEYEDARYVLFCKPVKLERIEELSAKPQCD